MTRRISFFISAAEWQNDYWRLAGDIGLGPLAPDDTFDGVFHQKECSEDLRPVRVVRFEGRTIVVEGPRDLALREGDILIGEGEGPTIEPPACAAALRKDGDRDSPEHAQPRADQPTLCGIPASEVEMYRHLFTGDSPRDCPTCTVRVWTLER
jgi:hypothetical protein